MSKCVSDVYLGNRLERNLLQTRGLDRRDIEDGKSLLAKRSLFGKIVVETFLPHQLAQAKID